MDESFNDLNMTFVFLVKYQHSSKTEPLLIRKGKENYDKRCKAKGNFKRQFGAKF